MPITAHYDHEADALYVRLVEGDQERTVEIDESTYVDLDANGRVVGLEFLYPSMGLNLQEVARRFDIQHLVPEITTTIETSGATVPLPTMTGGQTFASTSIVTVMFEGTIPATTPGSRPAVGHGDGYAQPVLTA